MPIDTMRLQIEILDRFNLSQLSLLCGELEINHEDLTWGNRPELARELIRECKMTNRLYELIVICKAKRPMVDWDKFNNELKDGEETVDSLDIQMLNQQKKNAKELIYQEKPIKNPSILRIMEQIITGLSKLNPNYENKNDEFDLVLIDAIEKSKEIVTQFARLASDISKTNNYESSRILFNMFEKILEEYYPKKGNNLYRDMDFDFYNFIGYELFLIYISFHIRERKWGFLADLLEEEYYVINGPVGRSDLIPYYFLSEKVDLLLVHGRKFKKKPLLVQGEILRKRYSNGELGRLISFENLLEADFFLFFREGINWIPWSLIYLGTSTPRFLIETKRKKRAEELLPALKAERIDELRERIPIRKEEFKEIFKSSILKHHFLSDFDSSIIGSKL